MNDIISKERFIDLRKMAKDIDEDLKLLNQEPNVLDVDL